MDRHHTGSFPVALYHTPRPIEKVFLLHYRMDLRFADSPSDKFPQFPYRQNQMHYRQLHFVIRDAAQFPLACNNYQGCLCRDPQKKYLVPLPPS